MSAHHVALLDDTLRVAQNHRSHPIPRRRSLRMDRRLQRDLDLQPRRYLRYFRGSRLLLSRRLIRIIAEPDRRLPHILPAIGVTGLILRLLAIAKEDSHLRRFRQQEVAVPDLHAM